MPAEVRTDLHIILAASKNEHFSFKINIFEYLNRLSRFSSVQKY